MNKHNQHIVVIGLGVSGFSCVKHCVALGKPVVVMDSRQQPPMLADCRAQYADVDVVVGEIDPRYFTDAEAVIVSPGVALSELGLSDDELVNLPIMGELDLFLAAVNAPLVAITGSNAKSTITTLVGEMATAAGVDVCIGGNLGVPMLDLLREKPPAWYILELSSFQLERCQQFHCEIGLITNLTPDHLDRYEDFADYVDVKMSLYRGCEQIVVNRDEPRVIDQWLGQSAIDFGLSQVEGDYFYLGDHQGVQSIMKGGEYWLALDGCSLKVMHEVSNFMAGFSVGCLMGLSKQVMCDVAAKFQGLAHRCQLIAQRQGVDWYDDSKATNIGATIAAINGLHSSVKGRLIVMAGGQGKGADFSLLVNVFNENVDQLIVFGEDADLLRQAVGGCVKIDQVTDLNAAVNVASQLAVSDDVVLFSPACASFDQFKDYKHRGEMFQQYVKEL